MTPWRIGFVPFLFCLLGLSLVPLVSSRSQESRDTVYQLSPITVTSPRTPEALLEVPLAVSLIPQRVFQHTRLLGLNEALALTPGVLAQSRAGGLDMRLTIRGFGARGNGDRSNAGTIRGIRVLLDGFPLSEPDGRTSLDMVDLWSAGSLEVIRSNATALYGGASGGLIQVNSATNGEEPFVSAGAILGSFGLTSQMVQAGLPLGAGKLFLSAGNMNFSGWRDHSSGTRAILHAVATAPLGDQSRVSVHLSGTSNLFKIPGPLTLEQYDANPQQADSTYLARDERRSNKLARLGVKLDHTLSEHQSISFIAFVEPKVLQRSERNRFRDFNRYHVGGSGTYSLALNLSRSLEGVFLAGFDEAYQSGSILFYTLDGGNRGTTLVANKEEGANSVGLFAQGEVMIAGRWSLLLGGRFDQLTYGADDFIDPPLAATRSFNAFTPKLGLSFRWHDTHTVYASIGGGLEVPAFNEIDPPPPFDTLTSINPFLDPMRSQTYEVGVKGISVSGHPLLQVIRYDVAAYLIDVTDDLVPYDGGAYFLTAGRSRRMGVEIGIAVESAYGLSLRASATVSDNTYREYRNELGDFSGNDVAGLPCFALSAALRYDAPGRLFVEALVQHGGGYYADDANSSGASVGGSTVLTTTVGGSFTTGSLVLDVHVGVHNLTDEKYVASAFINGIPAQNTTMPRYFEPGLPRNFVGGIRLRWVL